MKKILAALAITAVFASCKKENVISSTPVTATDKKVVKIMYTDSGSPTETETITYDTQGRISVYTTEDRIYSFSYESDSRLVVTTRKKLDNTIQSIHECSLNSKGAIVEDLIKDPAGIVTYTYQYTYDANNQMFKVKGIAPSGSNYEYVAEIVSGNIASAKQYSDGLQYTTTIYYYDGTKTNKLPSTLGGYWPSHVLYGKSGSLLISETKSTNMSGIVTWNAKTSYVLDADGYVASSLTNYIHNGDNLTAVYQYQ